MAPLERNITETNAFYRYALAAGLILVTWDAIPFLCGTRFFGLGVGIGLSLVALTIVTGTTRKCPAWALFRLPGKLRTRASHG